LVRDVCTKARPLSFLESSSTLILWSSVMYKHNQPAFRITALRDCALETELSPVMLGRGFADT
jgi:hypothetical protein